MLGTRLGQMDSAEPKRGKIPMVGLTGQLCGVMSICCSVQAAVRMASKILGVEPDQSGQEVRDAFGEVCKMVAAGAGRSMSAGRPLQACACLIAFGQIPLLPGDRIPLGSTASLIFSRSRSRA
jgi:Chemotaxis phosphatase CheX